MPQVPLGNSTTDLSDLDHDCQDEEDAIKSLEGFYEVFMGPDRHPNLEEQVKNAKFCGRAPYTGNSKHSERRRQQHWRELEGAAASCNHSVFRAFEQKARLKHKHIGVDGRQGDVQMAQEKTHQFHAHKFEEKLQRIISRMDLLTMEESDVTDISDDDKDFCAKNRSICTSTNVSDMSAEPEAVPERPDYSSDEAIASVEGILIEEEPKEDVLVIVAKLLKHAVKVHTKKTLRNIMMLTAIKYRRLPEHTKFQRIGAESLLDNEAVVAGVQRYLAEQNLGAITLHLLTKHVNEVLIPGLTLEAQVGKNSITERTVQCWLWKLGYRNVESRKGAYMDGHECCCGDNSVYRKKSDSAEFGHKHPLHTR
ncbi:uncharacterized protein EI90DRAFT_3124842 [Cantharellus anzutake]|uniref:uncharacterized protein n=1 Tax=Cantharellus anzutake TaxID=1750568 RepID=UPI001904B13D|nr:uncharacterized protein EI90DRAFT_3124842 [Cantharellus anzutake]KAF8330037.1 hypothetical protein EI90DRAFT_3124842 [Cantharellus anzutake]